MKALQEPRIEDLGPGDHVKVECACGHTELLTAEMLMTKGLASYRHVLDLKRHLRCRACDERGKAVVCFRWAEAKFQSGGYGMDLYTKAVLTVIALALSAIVLQHAGVIPAFAQDAQVPVAVYICDANGRCGLGVHDLPLSVSVER
jgi:hypothetical protein